MKNLILVAFLAVVAIGCKKENPYIDPPPPTPATTANHVAFIWSNDVYYMSDIRGSATRITTTATTKTMVRMSHDHTRFAYLNASNIIEVVDNTGAVLYSLPQFTFVNDFNWSANDSTLYILSGNQIQYYGPSMGLPAISYPGVPATAQRYVLSMSVSAANDLAYVIYYEDTWAGPGSVLVIKPHDGSPTLTRDLNDPFRDMKYVRFSIHETDLILGYTIPGSDNWSRLEMFTGLSMTPVRTLESSQEYYSPVYRSDLNLITGGYASSNSSSVLTLAALDLTASSLTEGNAVVLNNYTAGEANMWVDWK